MTLRPPTLARGGMVVASQSLAAGIGRDMLRQGGHAVDAIVATGLALAVIEPSASGLGGDAFLLMRERGTGGLIALNGSGGGAHLPPPRPIRRTGGGADPRTGVGNCAGGGGRLGRCPPALGSPPLEVAGGTG
ncbi:MAG: gamma-glutamyltransferase [Candidatus Eisenbacteria bacterium]